MEQEEIFNILELDTFDPKDLVIALSFALRSVRNLDSRNGYYSKTLTVPATKRNNTILGFSYDVTAEHTFNRNERKRCRIELNGVRMLDGYVELTNVIYANGILDSYELVIYSNNSDWFNQFEGLNIRDLDLGTLSYTSEFAEDSWTNNGDSINPYTFPFVDFGYFEGLDNSTAFTIDRLVPAIFVKKIVKKMFSSIGYSIEGGFMDKIPYRDVILHSPKEFKLNDEAIKDNRAKIGITTAQTIEHNSLETDPNVQAVIRFNDELAPNYYDSGNNYNSTSTYKYITPSKGSYDVEATLKIAVTADLTNYPNDQWYYNSSDAADQPTITIQLLVDGVVISDSTNLFYPPNSPQSGLATYSTSMLLNASFSSELIEAGSSIECRLTVDNQNGADYVNLLGVAFHLRRRNEGYNLNN